MIFIYLFYIVPKKKKKIFYIKSIKNKKDNKN